MHHPTEFRDEPEKLVEASVVDLSYEARDSEIELFRGTECFEGLWTVVDPADGESAPMLPLGTLLIDALLLFALLARFYVRAVAALAWPPEPAVASLRCRGE